MKTGNQSSMKAKAKVIWCSTHFVYGDTRLKLTFTARGSRRSGSCWPLIGSPASLKTPGLG